MTIKFHQPTIPRASPTLTQSISPHPTHASKKNASDRPTPIATSRCAQPGRSRYICHGSRVLTAGLLARAIVLPGPERGRWCWGFGGTDGSLLVAGGGAWYVGLGGEVGDGERGG